MAAEAGLLYRHAGPVLIRATTDPGGLALPDDLDLFGASDTEAESARAWLAQLWRRDDVREAIHLASPVLSCQVDKVLAGRKQDAREVRRIVVSLASYLLRWQGRPTPFGLFAGMAVVTVGGQPVVRWGTDHRVVVRADARWLGTVIDRLERCADLLERLPVVANGAAFVRGDRLVVPGQSPDAGSGQFAPLEVSVRYTRPVRAALETTREPIGFSALVTVLSGDFPAASPQRVCTMLAELVAQGVLVTGLRAPMTVPDALGHVCAQLEDAGAEELPEVAGLVAELRAIHDDLSRLGGTTHPAVAMTSRAQVAKRMRAVCETAAQPLVLGVGLDCEIALPELVIREAEAAASALLRLTPYPFGYRRWTEYHVRFRTRHGPGAVIPVSELVQADTGLGLPAGYLGAPPGRTGRMLTERDETLLALIQQAVMDRNEEILLTEPDIRALTAGDPAEMLPPPRTELAFQLHAPSPAAVARGAFRLMVTAAPRPGSSMAGRFADLLPDDEQDRLADAYAALSTDDPDTIAAQMSFPPRRRHSENVIRTPQLLSQVISLSEHRKPHADLIPLHDLAVSADSRRLYLVQLSTGRRVEPRVLHALEAGLQTPPLARFLAEVTTGRCAVYGAFDWGAAARLPYLPRVRYGRSVLSPARWLLSARDLPARTATGPEWETALDAWRRRLRAPAAVVLCESDLRLPLDLDHPAHRALLRARLGPGGQAELREATAPADLAWLGRAHELLLFLHLARPSPAEQQPRTVSLPRAVARDAGHLPGRSPWLYALIHGHPDRQDEILIDHLPRLFDGWDDPLLWWFQRYREMTRPDIEQYLGLYLRLPTPELYGAAAARVGEWAADLRDCGLVPQLHLGTYHPETGRYGHGAAMTSAEQTFAADSVAALAQIELSARTGTSPEAVTAAGLVDLAVSYTETPAEGMRWLIEHLPQDRGRVDRSLRDEALGLADPRHDCAALHALPGGTNVVLAWQRRRNALAAYHDQLGLQRDPRPVLRSLLHMHHVRTIGVTPDRERVTQRLARAAALRWSAQDRRDKL
ncbi:MAG TPA: lantibiotic dehydratase [Pseudonocardiaceae bacterium]|jgi:thiopeptide-type bacteriocin biosynthesis protein|nr:lantibiotic dehydratase [Pseudonocardiaceae bacterium]